MLPSHIGDTVTPGCYRNPRDYRNPSMLPYSLVLLGVVLRGHERHLGYSDTSLLLAKVHEKLGARLESSEY